MVEITGIGVGPGRAVGPVVRMPEPFTGPPEEPTPSERADVTTLGERITAAGTRVRDELSARAAKARGESKAILEAAALMAVDPALVGAARQRVSALVSPARAVWDSAGEVTAHLTALGGYLAERARDVADVRDRIVAELSGLPAPGLPDRVEPYVLVARDLAPVDTAMLDPATCLAVVTAEGGPTSHTTILLRSLGLPAIVAAGGGALQIADGTVVLVDSSAGTVRTDPDPAEISQVRSVGARVPAFDGKGRTADGHRIRLMVNIDDPANVSAAVAAEAEGVGLFRTEFCFLGHARAPTVDEQVGAYREVLAAFPRRIVTVRTLDAGGDKPLPFLHRVSEPNPALGVRGLRTAVHSERVLSDQLAAIVQAARREKAEVWVMAPMVTTPDEAAEFVARCEAGGLDTPGVMIEVPGAALSAAQIFESARFASIGTNDLAQYTMAADRGAGELASLN
ncbi:MAG TPA: putative PEP-binding protein, partial [Actinomycetes bacterium]|nr:putative PEP-binding protein [Actinomycetes bacterium]